jgi:hypothetical protein
LNAIELLDSLVFVEWRSFVLLVQLKSKPEMKLWNGMARTPMREMMRGLPVGALVAFAKRWQRWSETNVLL